MILAAGALLGLIAVAFGAYAEHALRPELTAHVAASLQTALRYNELHALVITAIGLFRLCPDAARVAPGLNWAAAGFIAGTLLFSFSIYLSVLLERPALTTAAPVGGSLLMAAWATLVWIGLRSLRR